MPLLGAFIRRDARIQLSYRSDLALQVLAIVFNLAMFFYIAKLVDDSEVVSGVGTESGYFAFVVIGLAGFRIAQTGLVSFTAKLRLEQTTGTLEALITTPTRPLTVVLYSAAFDLLRGTVLALVTILGAVVIFGADLQTGPTALATAVLAVAGAVAVLASAGVLIAAATLVVKQTATLVGLAVTGLSLLGGVYFPLEVLPSPLEEIGEALPFTWAIDALRSGLLEADADIGRVAALFASAAVLVPLSGWVLDRALEKAKREGSLAQY
jgi:ABC-2 type transport system permease protein